MEIRCADIMGVYLCEMPKAIFVLFLFISSLSFSQDQIHLRSGEIVKALVMDVGTQKIRYKKWSNQEGPNYFLDKFEINKIVFQNGAEDFFDQIPAPKERKTGLGIAWLPSILSNNIAEPYAGGAIEVSHFVVPKLALELGAGNGSEGFFLWLGANVMFKDTRTERLIPYAGISVINTQLYNRAFYQGLNFPLGLEFIHHKSGFNAGVELSYLNILNDVGYLRANIKLGYRF